MTQQNLVHLGDLAFDVLIDGPADGVPVVLLHGWPQDARSWNAVARELAAKGARTIAPDQRGYSPGARPEAVEDYELDKIAADAIGLAAALGHDRFHLVGHDWGASAAWYIAANHPENIETVTAISVPHLAAFGEAVAKDADQQARSDYFRLFRKVGKAEEVLLENNAARLRSTYTGDLPDDAVNGYVERLSQPGALTASLNWYRAMTADMGSTPAVTMPATFIWGNNDPALGRYGAERCGEYVNADYKFVEVEGGHWLPDTHAHLVAEEIAARIGV